MLSNVLTRILGFLREGYPQGVPRSDYVPLFALLRRRLSDEEVATLATELSATGQLPLDGTDVRVAITKLTNDMPSAEDTARVRRLLVAAGWPVTEPAEVLDMDASASYPAGPDAEITSPPQTYPARPRQREDKPLLRTAFHQQLGALTTQLGDMCALATNAIEHATQALLTADLVLAEDVIAGHDTLAMMSTGVAERATVLLALQAPVAGELRAVVGALRTTADIERMGGLALHVAKIARRRHPRHALPEDVGQYFAEMGRIAVELGTNTQHVLLSGDPRQAAQIRHDDDAMDDLHRHLFTVVMDRNWTHGVAVAVDVTLLGRFYERYADHTVDIARRVIFQRTGQFRSDDDILGTS